LKIYQIWHASTQHWFNDVRSLCFLV